MADYAPWDTGSIIWKAGPESATLEKGNLGTHMRASSSFMQSATTRNTTGHIMTLSHGVGPPYYHGCMNHYVWRDHLFSVAKQAVDLEIGGIEFMNQTISSVMESAMLSARAVSVQIAQNVLNINCY